MILNSSQLQAIAHTEGPMLVLAGPGSGKTSVAVRRMINLIQNHSADPSRILTVTFSRAAADEMAARFRDLYPSCSADPVIGTFHSIFLKLMKESGYYGHIMLISEKQKYQFIMSEVKKYRIDTDSTDQLVKDISRLISCIKSSSPDHNNFHRPGLDNAALNSIYISYCRACRDAGMIDYDDILSDTLHMLKNDSAFFRQSAAMYRYILIDEFQDINRIQYEIIRLLASRHNNIFAVGDDDQCIYGFRGSSPDIMKQYIKDYPSCRVLTLNTNYRCAEEILVPSLNLISCNKDRLYKSVASSFHTGDDTSFTVGEYADLSEEYENIAGRINYYRAHGIPSDRIAVLMRNGKDLAYVRKFLSSSGIIHTSQSEGFSYAEHFICKDITAFFRCASGCCDRSDVLRIINRPERYISRLSVAGNSIHEMFSSILKYYDYSDEIKCKLSDLYSQLAFLKELSPAAGLEYILRAMGYECFLKGYADSRNADKKESISVLTELKQIAALSPSVDSFLESVSHNDDTSDHHSCISSDDSPAIMTMHASKGLEFEVVFLPDINKNIIPSSRCTRTEDICEERRLMYVAMTRAKKHLHVSWVKSMRQKSMQPSGFIKEMLTSTD